MGIVLRERHCPVSVAFDMAGRTKLLYCGQWTCPKCAVKLARKWAAIIKYHVKTDQFLRNGDEWGGKQKYWFITFTLPGRVSNVKHGFAMLPRLWDGLRKKFYRKYAYWRYLAFVEGQPKRGGMPHFHIISDVPIPVWPNKNGVITKRMVHDFAYKSGFGFQAEQETINSSKAAAYVAKYASKQHPAIPKNFRRVRPSALLFRQERDPDKKWLVKARNETLAAFLVRVSEATLLTEIEVYTRMMDCWAENAKDLPRKPNLW